ncbi:hypothetical protein CCP4SC76_300008 [Gammaproteobacteria bacterium]
MSSKRNIIFLSMFLAVLVLYQHFGRIKIVDTSVAETSPKSAAISVLFVGNSFTSVNNLPQIFSTIAASLGDQVSVDMYAPGGYTFEGHAKDLTTREKIQSRDWSFVVLQEQSQRPSFNAEQIAEQVVPHALFLDKLIHTGHASTKTVFYETWGRKDGDSSNCKDIPAICTYDGMQRRLSDTYADLARRTSGILVPVGMSWRHLRHSHPELNLYAADGVHPSIQGTYLAACVFYATLFHKSPIKADSLGLKATDAELLQRTAEEVVNGL